MWPSGTKGRDTVNVFESAFLQYRRSSGTKLAGSIVISGVLGAIVFTLFSILANSAASIEDSLLGKESSMSYVVVDSTTAGGNEGGRGLGPADLDEIGGLDGVTRVIPWSKAGLMTTTSLTPEGTMPKILWAASEIPGVHPQWTTTVAGNSELKPGEIAVPEKMEELDFSALLGQTIEVTYQRAVGPGMVEGVPVRLRVAALFDGEAPNNDGPGAVYANLADVDTWAAENMGVSVEQFQEYGRVKAYARVADANDVAAVQRELQNRGFHAESQASLLAAMQPVFSLLRNIALVLGGVYALTAVLSGLLFGSFVATMRAKLHAVTIVFGVSKSRIFVTSVLEVGFIAATISLLAVLFGIAMNCVLMLAVGGKSWQGIYFLEGFILPSPTAFAYCVLVPLVLTVAVAAVKLGRAINATNVFEVSREGF